MTVTHSEIPEADRIPVGTAVEILELNPEFDAKRGVVYLVEEYVTADQGDAEPPQPYYMLECAPGQGYWSSGDFASPSQLRVIRTAKEQRAIMKMPEPKVLMKVVQSGLHQTFGDDIEIYESQLLEKAPTEDGFEAQHGYEFGVEFYGRRRGGVAFCGIVRLTGFWQTDD